MAVQRLNCLELLNKMNVAYDAGELKVVADTVDATTKTGLNGVLAGDGANVGAVETLPVSMGGTGAADTDTARLNLGAASNPNLLDNWDFRNPVNQRGETEYTKAGYTIDRWMLSASSGLQLTITDDGISFTADTYGKSLQQYIENQYEAGTVLTASLIVGEGVTARISLLQGSSVLGRSNYVSAGLVSVTVTTLDNTDDIRIFINVSEAGTVILKRAKLELGSVSTIENDPPADHATELLGCQRYFQIYSSASARPSSGVDCRPVMRIAAPTQGTAEIDGTTYYYNSADL